MRRHALAKGMAQAALVALVAVQLSAGEAGPRGPATQPTTRPATVKIDMDRAVALELPAGPADLTPRQFKTTDGREGWVIHIPGDRPIATPAYADGMIFVGGGYGSHEFYAFDANTGSKVWELKTGDDGPTAAVVEGGCVAFNTESCTVIIADARTGKVIWQEWLGDPLMSQPAISKGKMYIAYPGGNPRGPVRGDGRETNRAGARPAGPATGHGHRLLCADLRTGEHLWEQDITGDVISAPVIEADQVYFTCFDGTSFALNCDTGAVAWKKHNSGTSAPLIAEGKVLVTEREENGQQVREGVRRLDVAKGEPQTMLLAAGDAEYLKRGRGGAVALSPAMQKQQDASVGFAAAPASANLAGAVANVNVSTVAGGWAYQGSRASYARGQILNAQANRLNCLRSKDGQVAWQAEAVGKNVSDQVQAFAPPALAGPNLYVCSAQGHLMGLRQDDGKINFLYSTGQPMAFQPALAKGNVYAPTSNGLLICLKTGDPTADGWSAWGGNAQHNKKD